MDNLSPSTPIITLTTDFGVSSRYVAAMKGVILSLNPLARLVDLTHAVPAQNIMAGAMALAETVPHFPPRTIHLAVVDPGVGTGRQIVYADIGNQQLVAPDNGLLGRLAACNRPSKIIALTASQFWRPHVSDTFHGRDIIAPVAAHLSLGLCPDDLGEPVDRLADLAWPEVHQVKNHIDGQIVEIDSFGNLITNITREMLADVPTDETVTIHCNQHETQGIFKTYGNQPTRTLLALIGSSDLLELAIVDDNASTMLGVGSGTSVRISW